MLTDGSVYNIIMDFVLASIPWIFTWNLHMRNVGKISLCITMSLVGLSTHSMTRIADQSRRAWSSPSSLLSAPAGKKTVIRRTNGTFGVMRTPTYGTPPRLSEPSSSSAFQCYALCYEI